MNEMRRMRGFSHPQVFCCETSRFREFRKPIADIKDRGNKLVIDIEVPGVDKKNIELNLTETSLEISAQRKTGKEMKKEGTYLCERSFSSFRRRASLPVEVIPEKAEAKFENGVLHIEVPKAKPEASGRKIEIK
jgi:HSP20 family protein